MTPQELSIADLKACTHEFISREYIGQPYGTCVCCGATIINPPTEPKNEEK